jgi:small subunit ribosomal protein S8
MLNDPLANVLNTIYLASKAGKAECIVGPVSKVVLKVLTMMQENGYIGDQEVIEDKKGGKIIVNLIGTLNKCGVIKPRFPVKLNNFEKFEKRYLPAKGFGHILISTSKGLMLHEQAKEQKVGGRLIAYIY